MDTNISPPRLASVDFIQILFIIAVQSVEMPQFPFTWAVFSDAGYEQLGWAKRLDRQNKRGSDGSGFADDKNCLPATCFVSRLYLLASMSGRNIEISRQGKIVQVKGIKLNMICPSIQNGLAGRFMNHLSQRSRNSFAGKKM